MFNVKHNCFINIVLPSSIIQWNNLDTDFTNSENIGAFIKKVLLSRGPTQNFLFKCHNPKGSKVLTRPLFCLSHLHENKFKRSFQDSLYPYCNFSNGNIKTCCYFLFHSSHIYDERLAVLSFVKRIDTTILQQNHTNLTRPLLFMWRFLW